MKNQCPQKQGFLLFACYFQVVLGIMHVREEHMESKTRVPDSGPSESQGEEPPCYSEAGIDVSLIRWTLSLTPAQRLQVLQQATCSLQKLRHANPAN